MTRIVYQDTDEFADALRGTVGCFIRTAPSELNWWIDGIELATGTMQHLHTGGPFTFAGRGKPGTLTFQVPLTNLGTVRVNGQILDADSFVILREDRPFLWSVSDASQWASVSVPLHHSLATSALASAGANGTVRRRTSPQILDSVKQLIDAARFMDTAAADGEISSALIHALRQSVPADPGPKIGRPQLSRSVVISSALAFMNAHEGQPVFIDDLCRATQVSERALRNMFHEFFGVGPMRLLKVRQLHEIRAALLRTQPQLDTVTHIAARFGVFDPSLLARNYKVLFGESPSRTLRQAPGGTQEKMRVGWLKVASRIFLDEDSGAM
ncbi:helix-turn-helix domain-containing protein [Peristeroidobacter soli]|uniref:helix-turn-helix domain-containing protein n=1 Tax=Peristeroidobacter soli TaxID=2497877 RepID=UPI00130077B5|nr:helix-turn-helix domain-containing protein [Peristeroidobacter soli]